MNRSKDLRNLFRESLKNKRIRSTDYRGTTTQYANAVSNGYGRIIEFGKSIKIYFYEWSDIYRVPITFNDIKSFEDYLKSCGIYMQLYQRDIIINCGTAYATCYKGSKELNLRGSYDNLQNSMKEHDKISKEIEEEKKNSSFDKLGKLLDVMQEEKEQQTRPISPMYAHHSTIQRPPMIEPEGRWAENGEYGSFWY